MITAILLALALDSTGSGVRQVVVAPRETLAVTIDAPADTASRSGTPVVFIPGHLGGAYGFRKVAPPLSADGHPTYIIELLGLGASSHPTEADYALDTQADRVGAVLDSLGVSSAIVVGANIGASVALRLAYRRPEHVRGVLSLDGGPADRPAGDGVSMAMKLAPLLRLFGARGIVRRHVRSALIEASASDAWVTSDVVDAYAGPIAADLGATLRMLRAMRRARASQPLGENLSRIRQPVRLLLGRENRRIGVGADETAVLAEHLADFAVDSVAGSGAYVQEERPDAVVAAVRALDQAAHSAVPVAWRS